SWFEQGSRLIYIVPSRAIGAILPLQIEPVAQTERVFVGRIELITPEILRSAGEAVAKKDWSSISQYGRFTQPILKRVSAANPSLAKQVQQMLRNIQASLNSAQCRGQ